MDKKLKQEIIETVRRALRESELVDEVWLTGEQLSTQFGFFTKAWLKSYGHTLPRTRAIVNCGDGTSHRSGWCYPRNTIQRMIMDGRIKELNYGQKD